MHAAEMPCFVHLALANRKWLILVISPLGEPPQHILMSSLAQLSAHIALAEFFSRALLELSQMLVDPRTVSLAHLAEFQRLAVGYLCLPVSQVCICSVSMHWLRSWPLCIWNRQLGLLRLHRWINCTCFWFEHLLSMSSRQVQRIARF